LALKVSEDTEVKFIFIIYPGKVLDDFQMGRMIGVGHIEPENINAGFGEGQQVFKRINGRANSSYDLGIEERKFAHNL